MTYTMTEEQMRAFESYLRMEEHSESTIQKYASAVMLFYRFLTPEKIVTKEQLLTWKARISATLAASTVNVMISAVNSFFAFLSWVDLRIRQVKTQRRIYRDAERELTKEEYLRLLDAARESGNLRLYYLMQTLAGSGIRVSELKFVTVEAVQRGSAVVDLNPLISHFNKRERKYEVDRISASYSNVLPNVQERAKRAESLKKRKMPLRALWFPEYVILSCDSSLYF